MSAQARLVSWLGKWKRFGPWRLLNKQKHCTVESLAWYGFSPKEMIVDIIHLFPKLSNLRSYSTIISSSIVLGVWSRKCQESASRPFDLGGSVPLAPSSLSELKPCCTRASAKCSAADPTMVPRTIDAAALRSIASWEQGIQVTLYHKNIWTGDTRISKNITVFNIYLSWNIVWVNEYLANEVSHRVMSLYSSFHCTQWMFHK